MFNASTLWPLGCFLMAAFLARHGWHLVGQMQAPLLHELLVLSRDLGRTIVLLFVFTLFTGWYSWMVQRLDIQFPEGIARFHFWVTLIGVVIMYSPGNLVKMPRILTDSPAPVFVPFVELSKTFGACLIGIGVILFFFGLYKALSK